MKFALMASCVIALSGCASVMTPTKEVKQYYAIYDIKPVKGVSPTQLTKAIKTRLQEVMSGVQFVEGIPPSPLPSRPARFNAMSSLTDTAVNFEQVRSMPSVTVVNCPGATLSASSQKGSLQSGNEEATFFFCLIPYAGGGHHLDMYSTYTKITGAYTPGVLAVSALQGLIGDYSQFIPQKTKAVLDAVDAAGFKTVLIEKYPADEPEKNVANGK